jgi:hypothetical protein
MAQTKDLAFAITELLDREQIKELRARYCWHVARSEGEELADLYVPNGLFQVHVGGPPLSFTGRAAIAESINRTPPGTIFPVIHNHTILITGDEATGTAVLEVSAPTLNPDRWSGYYHDRLRKVNGHWLFVERVWFRYWPTFERSGLDMNGRPKIA